MATAKFKMTNPFIHEIRAITEDGITEALSGVAINFKTRDLRLETINALREEFGKDADMAIERLYQLGLLLALRDTMEIE